MTPEDLITAHLDGDVTRHELLAWLLGACSADDVDVVVQLLHEKTGHSEDFEQWLADVAFGAQVSIGGKT